MSVSRDETTAFRNYLKHEKRFSPHTITAYLSDLRQFEGFIKNLDDGYGLMSADHHIIRHWVVSLMQDKLQARSVTRKLSTLRTYYSFLKKKGDVQVNPTSKVIAPKVGRRLPVYLKEDEIGKLFEQISFSEDWKGLRDQVILRLLYECGLRRGELMNLKCEDVDRTRSVLKVLGKGGKERLLPLSPSLQRLIGLYLKGRSDQFEEGEDQILIWTDKGNKVYPKYVYNKVVHYLKQVTSLEKVSPHVLRHTFATHLTDNGAEIKAVQDLLGHASLAATQVYTHNSVEKLKKAYKDAHPRS